MTHRFRAACIALLLPAAAFAQAGTPAPPRYPRLVVGIVVDQMRADYMYRFWDAFGDDGFRRLVREGFVFRQAHYNYMPTYTGPGHASIFTGTTPSSHGIISNYWYRREPGDITYCVRDPEVTATGGTDAAGRMSPRNLVTSTLGDELKLRFTFRPKVYGLAMKDRGAILSAGHAADAAFWFDRSSGNWITSSYYLDTLPAWMVRFNGRKLPDRYLSEKWTPLLPADRYGASLPDDNPYEGLFSGESRPVFPHDVPSIRQPGRYEMLDSVPAGNAFTAETAKEIIRSAGLGTDDVPDLLAVSFSSTDYIGHHFGPHSKELEDCYLRLDRDIAGLLHFLDSAVGRENVLVFLTADHGAVPNTRLLADHRIPGGTFDSGILKDALDRQLSTRFGKGPWVAAVSEDMVYLDRRRVADQNLNLPAVQDFVATLLRDVPVVARAVPAHDLVEREYLKPPLSLLQNGFYARLSGDVMMIMQPGYSDYGDTGTTHNTPYPYDTHVPLIFYGWRMPAGTSTDVVHIPDIAPTISELLDMDFPNGCTGTPLQDLLQRMPARGGR